MNVFVIRRDQTYLANWKIQNCCRLTDQQNQPIAWTEEVVGEFVGYLWEAHIFQSRREANSVIQMLSNTDNLRVSEVFEYRHFDPEQFTLPTHAWKKMTPQEYAQQYQNFGKHIAVSQEVGEQEIWVFLGQPIKFLENL